MPTSKKHAILLTVWHTGTKYFLEGLSRHSDQGYHQAIKTGHLERLYKAAPKDLIEYAYYCSE